MHPTIFFTPLLLFSTFSSATTLKRQAASAGEAIDPNAPPAPGVTCFNAKGTETADAIGAFQKMSADISGKPYVHILQYQEDKSIRWSSGQLELALIVHGASYDLVSTDSLLLAVDELFEKCNANGVVNGGNYGGLGSKKKSSIGLAAKKAP